MSPFLQITEGRHAYKRTDCAAKAPGAQVAPGSASVALRCLHAYPTVQGVDGKQMPMRGEMARLLVHAPPDTWGWCRPLQAHRFTRAPAASPQAHHPAEGWRTYTTEESDRIWIALSGFQEVAPLAQ